MRVFNRTASKVRGISRIADDDRTLLLFLDECPTDAQMRWMQDRLNAILADGLPFGGQPEAIAVPKRGEPT